MHVPIQPLLLTCLLAHLRGGRKNNNKTQHEQEQVQLHGDPYNFMESAEHKAQIPSSTGGPKSSKTHFHWGSLLKSLGPRERSLGHLHHLTMPCGVHMVAGQEKQAGKQLRRTRWVQIPPLTPLHAPGHPNMSSRIRKNSSRGRKFQEKQLGQSSVGRAGQSECLGPKPWMGPKWGWHHHTASLLACLVWEGGATVLISGKHP